MDLYIQALSFPKEKIAGKIFNVGYENHSLDEIADLVRSTLRIKDIEIVHEPTDDLRSYHISSQKIKEELGFTPRRSVQDAIEDLKNAFDGGKIPDPLNDKRYYNIKTMQALNLM